MFLEEDQFLVVLRTLRSIENVGRRFAPFSLSFQSLTPRKTPVFFNADSIFYIGRSLQTVLILTRVHVLELSLLQNKGATRIFFF